MTDTPSSAPSRSTPRSSAANRPSRPFRSASPGRASGLALVDLGQLKVDALGVLLPRITLPPLSPAEVANMDPADLLACGAEIGSFLLQKARRTDALAQ
jgi:hypothetical protein